MSLKPTSFSFLVEVVVGDRIAVILFSVFKWFRKNYKTFQDLNTAL